MTTTSDAAGVRTALSGSNLCDVAEFARRIKLTSKMVRAWQDRYAVFNPVLSAQGKPLFSARDEQTAHHTLTLRRRGLPLSTCCAMAKKAFDASGDPPVIYRHVDALEAAANVFDQPAIIGAARLATTELGAENSICQVFLPYLERLEGRRAGPEQRGRSQVVRHALAVHTSSIAQRQGRHERSAVIARPPGQKHDLHASIVSTLMSVTGWSVCFLGADTPYAAVP